MDLTVNLYDYSCNNFEIGGYKNVYYLFCRLHHSFKL